MAWLRIFPENLPQSGALAGPVVCIGNFDGVHAGHCALLAKAAEIAKEHGAEVVVLTFDPHPRTVLRPEVPHVQLMDLTTKQKALGEAGADGVAVVPFTHALAGWVPERFVEEILRGWLHAGAVVVGENFRFGAGASGSAATLREAGLRVCVVDLVRDGRGNVISSSALRRGGA